MKKRYWIFPAMLLLAMAEIGCGDDSTINDPANITTANARVSECGGFNDSLKRWAADDIMEAVIWSYDAESAILRILDSEVILNCCGDRTIEAQVSDAVITISESDMEPENGRCRCECSYDFAIDITGLSAGEYTLIVKRTIDQESRVLVETVIDLSSPSGSISIP